MNFKEYLKKNGFNVEEMNHSDFYRTIINALGYKEVKRCIPFTIERIKLSKDIHLNDLNMKKWDIASGFICNDKTGNCICVGSTLTNLYHKIGVNCYSNSDGVCILKECARMLKEEV